MLASHDQRHPLPTASQQYADASAITVLGGGGDVAWQQNRTQVGEPH